MISDNRSRVRYYSGRIEWFLSLFFSLSLDNKKEKEKPFYSATVRG